MVNVDALKNLGVFSGFSDTYLKKISNLAGKNAYEMVKAPAIITALPG